MGVVAHVLAGVVELLQQLDVDLALAGVLRQQVREVADLLLTDAVEKAWDALRGIKSDQN